MCFCSACSKLMYTNFPYFQLAGAPNLPFYKMTMVLEKLCDEVQLTSELLCHDKLKQHRKKDVQQKDSILFSLWARYMEHEVTENRIKLLISFTKIVLSYTFTVIYYSTVGGNRARTEIYFSRTCRRSSF